MLRRRCIYKKTHYLTFDPDLWVKDVRNVAQFPLLYVTYSATQFEVATFDGLGGDTFTRNVTDGQTDGRTLVQMKKAGITIVYEEMLFKVFLI